MQLPFHESRESAVGILAQNAVWPLFGYLAISRKDDDTVRAFDSRETMSDGNSGVVSL